jgi:lactate dehydrogenase-like 2-hydroxyacid dehydrogenase
LNILIMDPMAWDPVTGADLTIEHAEADGHAIVAMQTHQDETYPDEVYAGCDALLNCRGRHRLPAATLAKLTRCRIIVQAGVGFNHIDLTAAAELGIPVCNTPDYGTAEVADHAVALLLGLLRGVPFYDQALRQADTPWAPQPLPPVRRVTDLRVGIVGLGRIGLATALRLRGFGMRVAFHDPHQPPGFERAVGFERHDRLAGLLERSDVVSLHCPLSPATANLIGAAELACLPSGAVLVNTARGGLVDLDALATALRDGSLAGAALDVLPQEPIDRSHPLLSDWAAGAAWLRGRLIVTPHVAFHSPQSVSDMRRLSMRAVAGYLRDGTLRSCVNAALLKVPRP